MPNWVQFCDYFNPFTSDFTTNSNLAAVYIQCVVTNLDDFFNCLSQFFALLLLSIEIDELKYEDRE